MISDREAPSLSPDRSDPELDELNARLAIEYKIRDGAENLLQVFANDSTRLSEAPSSLGPESKAALRRQVEDELDTANRKIEALQARINEIYRVRPDLNEETASPEDVFAAAYAQYHSTDQQEALDVALDELVTLQSKEVHEQLESLHLIATIISHQPTVAFRIPIQDVVASVLPLLEDNVVRDVRSTAHRLVRLYCVDAHIVQELHTYHFLWFLTRSLTRDHKYDLEKQQALLTVRHLIQLTHTSGMQLVSVGLIRCIVALAENGEDRLRHVCLETLAELVVRDIQLVVDADGIRVLLQSLVEGPYEFAPSIAMVFLYLIDRPHLRAHLRPDVDIEIALAGLTEVGFNPKVTSQQEERMRSSGRIMVLMIKSWSGFLYLASGKRQAFKALVGALSASSHQAQEIVLDTFFEIFRIQTPDWLNPFVAGKRLTLFRRAKSDEANGTAQLVKDVGDTSSAIKDEDKNRLNLVDHYLALVLLVFTDVGLLDGLVTISELREKPQLSKKAAVLMGELLQLASRVLPQSTNARIQALPRLFSMAANFEDLRSRLSASSALHSVNSINRNRARLHQINSPLPLSQKRTRSNSMEDPLLRGQRHVESSKVRLGMQMDDTAFRNQLLESGVLGPAKDTSKTWNVDIVIDLLEGPLLHPKRMEEAIKGSKFLRRLMAFYHPLERRYADLPRTVSNAQYTKVAVTLISTLLGSSIGVQFLNEDKLLKQLSDCLALLDPATASTLSGSMIFSKKRMQSTMTSGYMEILGCFTKFDEGLKILERFKIFTLLYHITDLQNREDLTIGFIQNASYVIESHTRLILSKALTSIYPHVRHLATSHLAILIHSYHTVEPQEWPIKYLVTQLYDTSIEVRELTVQILEDACQSTQILEMVVQLRPSLDHLGYSGAPLLFRFLSTGIGARYLAEIDYIDRGLEEWFHERNEFYVVQLELQLAKLFNIDGSSIANTEDRSLSALVPLHFYGELVKTDEGRVILSCKGHLEQFADFIREFGLEDQNLEIISHLKSVLWAVGNVGATAGGLAFLEEEGIIPNIVEIAEDSLCFSVRGTCFFVLGLIASTPQGVHILEELGWGTATTPLGIATGVCIPSELDRLLWIPSPVEKEEENVHQSLTPPKVHAERQVVTALYSLGNHLLANAASRTLAKAKARQPFIFADPSMQFRALHIIDSIHLKLSVRRYILELFGVTFSVDSLQQIQEAGQQILANAVNEPVLSSALTDEQAEQDEYSPVIISKDHRQLGWPSGQSSVMKEGVWTDEEDSKTPGDDVVLPKIVLEPVIQIKGFLLSA